MVKQKRHLEYLQPPTELLQVAATFVIRTPTAILPLALLPSSAPTFSSAPPQSYKPHDSYNDNDNDPMLGPSSTAATPPAGAIPSRVPVTSDDEDSLEHRDYEAYFRDQVDKLSALPLSQRFQVLFRSYSSEADTKLDGTQYTFDILGYLAFHYMIRSSFAITNPSSCGPQGLGGQHQE